MAATRDNKNVVDEAEYTEEERDIIGKEAARLRWEFEEERAGKRKSHHSNASNDIFQAEASHSMAMLADLDRQVKEAMNKKQDSLRELKDLQSQLKSNRSALPMPLTPTVSSLDVASPRMPSSGGFQGAFKPSYDSGDFQLMDFKIEAAKRELNNIDDQISSRRKMFENTLGINTAEVLAIIEERDSLKKRISSGEYAFSYVEKLELERQVNMAKEHVFTEQKNSRKNAEKFQEEIDECQKTIEDYQTSNQELMSKIDFLEREVRTKTEEGLQREDQLRGEIRELRNEIEDRKVAEHRLSLDAADKEKSNQELHQIIIEKEKQASQAHEAIANLCREKSEEISNLKSEHAAKLRSVIEKIEAEQKTAMTNFEKNKAEEIKDLAEKQRCEIAELKSTHCKIIENYSYDIECLKKTLCDEQQKSSEIIRKMKLDFEDDLKSTVHKERMFNDEEQSRLVTKEKQYYEDEIKRVSTRLNETIEYEKSQNNDLKNAYDKLKKDMEKTVEKNKIHVSEVTHSHETAVENIRGQHAQELDQLKQRLTSERNTEVERLCKQIDELEMKLRDFDREHGELTSKVDNFFNVFDHHEKTIVCEINDVCKMMAEALDIDPRKVTSKMTPVKPHQLLMNPALQKTTTRNCLANMRATVTDLVNNYGDLKKVVNGLRHQLKDLRRETEQKLVLLTDHMSVANAKEQDSIKEELESAHTKIVAELQNVIKQREDESDDLRKKLKIMEHEVEGLHKSMSKWKEETASRLSHSFETEMKGLYLRRMREEQEASEVLTKQKLLIKLEDQVSRLKGEQTMGKSTDQSTVKLINHLQDRIHSLKMETSNH